MSQGPHNFPQPTINNMQSLNKSIFSSFENVYNSAIDSCLRRHPGVPMTEDIMKILNLKALIRLRKISSLTLILYLHRLQ